jgi:hypothetical protein
MYYNELTYIEKDSVEMWYDSELREEYKVPFAALEPRDEQRVINSYFEHNVLEDLELDYNPE